MTDGRIVYASPESLYVATERWLDRPDPDRPTDGEERRHDRDPQVRHLEPGADAVPRQRPACPGTCSASGRSRSTAACSASSAPRARPGGGGGGGETRVVLDDAARERRVARPGRPDRRAGQGRARLRGALRRRRRLRGHVPPDRPSLHGRPRRPGAPARARRAEDPGLLRLPPPGRGRPAARRRPGRQRGRTPARHAAIALRRLRPAPADPPAQGVARPGLVGGGVRPPRLPLLAAHRPRRAPVRAARGRLPRRPRGRDRPGSGRSSTSGGSSGGRLESGAPSSCATPCSRSRTAASSRAASRRSSSAAGPPSRRPRSRSRNGGYCHRHERAGRSRGGSRSRGARARPAGARARSSARW